MPKLLRKKIQATYGENASKRLRKRLAQNTSHSVSNANWYQSAEELLRMRVDRHYLKVKEVSLPNHVSKQVFYLKVKTIEMSMHTRIWHLPRSQTSLSLRKGWARKGGREGERMRDVWQILFSRWRNVQWRMITQFSKRSIDLFVLRILKEKWFFLIQCARRKQFSYNWTGYSIITGFAISLPLPPLIC